MAARWAWAAAALVASAIATSCIPGDPGSEVQVENRCDTLVRFSLEGGRPPAQPDTVEEDLDEIEAHSSKEYSTLIDDAVGYLLVAENAKVATFDVPSDGGAARVVLDGELCP